MSTNTTHDSAACCTRPIPDITSSSTYQPKGAYQTHVGTKCYVVGPQTATQGVFFIYDVFGYQKPTLQGADILASAGYLVVMPDLFDGQPAQMEWLQEEPKTSFGAWMSKIQDPKPHTDRIYGLVGELKTAFSSVEKWGSIGFCWGGKLVSLTSSAGTPFSVGIESSPARVDPEDAKKATVPIMMLASKDEPEKEVAEFDKALTVPKHVETFSTQIHGWMSARADLEDAEVRKEYERGYQLALGFFEKHM